MTVIKKVISVFALVYFSLNAMAQQGLETGIWLGAVNYFGDLNTNMRLNRLGPAGGVGVRYNFNERVCGKLSANMGRVEAFDKDSPNIFERARNLHFRSLVADLAAQMEFNFLPYIHGSNDYNWTPYLFAGLGVSYFNPKAELDGAWYELRPLGTEGQFKGEEYYTVAGGWVYGAGFKIDLNYEWSLNIDISARRLFTDYLDDVSTTYADPDDVQDLRGELAPQFIDRSLELYQTDPDFFTRNNIEAPIGEPGRQRGNSKTNDTYVYLGIGIFYYFGDLKCPYEK
ncbi:MAG: outer membrane beta-barrel protein [Bacteroidetes bacterium]|nr:outer membrane beta-barrel protein [Bacteroidota bacterium]